MQIKLEEKTVRTLPFTTAGQRYYFDTKMAGLGICVGNKTKSFFLQRTINHKTTRVKLGRFPEINCTQAREKAMEVSVQLNQGNNPNQIKREKNHLHSTTLGTVYDQYAKALSAQEKTTSFIEYPQMLNRHLSDWLIKPISHITKEKVIERHQFITKHSGPAIANKVFRLLRAIFNYLAAEDDRISNPVKVLTTRKRWNKESHKTTKIKTSQLGAWLQSGSTLPNDITRFYILFVLLHGLRKREALSLRWDNIDLDEGTFTITHTKNKKPLTLPITSYTRQLLDILETYRINDFVFPSQTSKSGHLEEPRKSLSLMNKQAGTQNTVHDLRRTFLSIANTLHLSPYTLKKLINHSLRNDVTAIYISDDVTDLRQPLQSIQDHIFKLSEIDSQELLRPLTHPQQEIRQAA